LEGSQACVRPKTPQPRTLCGRSQAMRGASFPCREMWVWVWVWVLHGYVCRRAVVGAGGGSNTASSACSFELRAGLGDLRHRGINPSVSRALGRPTAFLDWHRSFGSDVTRSHPFFEAPPDVSGLTSHTHWQSRTPKWRLFVVARTRELKGKNGMGRRQPP